MNKYHLLITHANTTFMKLCRGLAYHFSIMHNVLSSHHIFIKSDFILKIPSTCIDCIFKKQNMFIKNGSILISISRKQYSSLLNVFPHKLVTRLCNIDTTSALPRAGQPKLSGQLGRCAPSKTVYCQHGVHYRRIIINVVLLLSPVLF